jgi:hypothetical protein
LNKNYLNFNHSFNQTYINIKPTSTKNVFYKTTFFKPQQKKLSHYQTHIWGGSREVARVGAGATARIRKHFFSSFFFFSILSLGFALAYPKLKSVLSFCFYVKFGPYSFDCYFCFGFFFNFFSILFFDIGLIGNLARWFFSMK